MTNHKNLRDPRVKLFAASIALLLLIISIAAFLFLSSRSARRFSVTDSESRVNHPSHANGEVVIDPAPGRAYTTRGTVVYLYPAPPPSADYCVQADFYSHSTVVASVGIGLRTSATQDSMYLLQLNGGAQRWEVIVRNA